MPLLKSYAFFSEKKTVINNKFQPVLNISLGYAISNLGDKITYNADVGSDLLPRQVKIGYAISAGLKQVTPDFTINLLAFDWSSEAGDLLVQWSDNNWEYQKSPGEIKFWDNVILAKSNDDVKIYQGWRIDIVRIWILNLPALLANYP